ERPIPAPLHRAEGAAYPFQNLGVLLARLKGQALADVGADAVDDLARQLQRQPEDDDLGVAEGVEQADRERLARGVVLRGDQHDVPAHALDVAEELAVPVVEPVIRQGSYHASPPVCHGGHHFSRFRSRTAATSHRLTLRSMPPVASVRPSGLNATTWKPSTP